MLCEKPIGLDAEEARPLIDARNRSGKLVAEAFMVRFHPQWRRARELARDGAIGERKDSVSSPIGCSTPTTCATGPRAAWLDYIGCYAILTARYIFAAEPVRVIATIDRDPNFQTDRQPAPFLSSPAGAI